jgi:hypothetical protein
MLAQRHYQNGQPELALIQSSVCIGPITAHGFFMGSLLLRPARVIVTGLDLPEIHSHNLFTIMLVDEAYTSQGLPQPRFHTPAQCQSHNKQ